MSETENSVVTIARLIDPDVWAHAEEYASAMNAAAPQMQPFFEQQVRRLTNQSMQAAIRVLQHLQPVPTEPAVPDILSEVSKPKTPNRKTRRSAK